MSSPEPSQASGPSRASAQPDARVLMATCVSAAVRASAIVQDGAFNRGRLTWQSKGPSDFVTDVDRASEAATAEIIRERHPAARVVGEELSPNAAADLSGLAFIVDPLDGTTNFLHGYPWYAVS